MSKQVVPALLMLVIFMSVIPSVAENGSITITRVDNESLTVIDNDSGDMVDFCIGDKLDEFRRLLIVCESYESEFYVIQHPIVAISRYNYSTIINKTDIEIIDLIQCQYTARKLELAEIKRKEEQAARDLANRTHANTYEWVKGESMSSSLFWSCNNAKR
jgi:hypothetical protein